MIANEGFKSARDNFGKFIYQFQPETKTLLRKLERQNLSLLSNETYLNIYIYIYIYIYEVSVAVKQMYVNNSNCDS